MQALDWFHISVLLWFVFLFFWIVSARKLKAVKRREPVNERLLYMIPIMLAYILLFTDPLMMTPLGRRFIGPDPRIGAAGVAITAIGVALAIWARRHLGENWSATVTLKTGHELIASGPYRAIRHPIYTGIMLAVAGTALAQGQLRGLMSLAIVIVAFYFKARKEERYLLSEFGEWYRTYASRTGMLLPKFG